MSQPPDPLDRVRSELDSLRRGVAELQRRAGFADVVRGVTDRVARLHATHEEVGRLRQRGWVWDPEWEKVLADLERRGPDLVRDLRQETAAAADRIGRRLDQLEAACNRITVSAHAQGEIDRLEREKGSLDGDVSSVDARIDALVRPFTGPFDTLERELKETDTHLDRFEAARFQLAPGENPWLTVDATWEDSPSGKLNGFLYFTDRRVRFEQKETITTKKWLFFTASSEEKHELLLDEPVGNLVSSDDTTRGLVFKDQLLTLKWGSGARYRQTTFDVNTGYAKEWDQRIEDLKAGKLGHLMIASVAANPNRGVPVDPPGKCQACGAGLDAPVRGQGVLVCRFCSHRHDLVLAP